MQEPNEFIHTGFRATLYGSTDRGHRLGSSIPILTFGLSDNEYLLSIGHCVGVAMVLWKVLALRGFIVRRQIGRDHGIYGLRDYWGTEAPTIGLQRVGSRRVLKSILRVERVYTTTPCRSDTMSVMWLSAPGAPT